MLKSKFFKLKYIQFYSFVVGVFTGAQAPQTPFLCQIQSWNSNSGCNSTRTTTTHFRRWREVTSWLKTERERKENLDWAHDLIEFTDLTVILKPWCGSLHRKPFKVSLFVCQVKDLKNKNKMVKKKVPAAILCTSIPTTREGKKCLEVQEIM